MTTHRHQLRSAALVALFGAAGIFGGPANAADRIVATEDYKVRIVPVVTGLEIPWGMTFLDRDRILLTEKPGRMRVVEGGKLLAQPVAGLPVVRVHGQGGLLDVTTHPQFARNALIYWSFAAGEDAEVGTEVARGKLSGDATRGYRVDNVEVIFRQQPKRNTTVHFGNTPSTPVVIRYSVSYTVQDKYGLKATGTLSYDTGPCP